MGGGPIIIPLVTLLIPILLLVAAIVFDAVFISWVVYRVWHDRGHGRLGRVLQRPP
jgi:uncharacterized membrane protein YfcA